MRLKFDRLLVLWAFLDLLVFGAGVVIIVASVIFTMSTHVLDAFYVSKFDEKVGIAVGILYLIANLISVPAMLQRKDRTAGLTVLNAWLLLCILVTLMIGTIIWIFSLRQLQEYSDLWDKATAQTQEAIQNMFSCCGYWNGTSSGGFSTVSGFCADPTTAAKQVGCQLQLTASSSPGSDFILNNIFTSLYGFEALLVCLFLATICVINQRKVEVRFAKIDQKRGGGGFV